MSEWKKVRLGEVVEFNPRESIKKGVVAKKVAMDRLVPFCREISGYEQEPFAGGSKFRNGDTLVARITPCLENGKTAYVSVLDKGEVGFGSTEYIVLRSREGVTNDRYVYYLATSPWFRGIAIQSMVGSSGRQRVQQDVLEHLEVRLPSLGEQERIAGVLGALDDKIELNNRINRNLEQQAEALFARWFVDFEENGSTMQLKDFFEVRTGKKDANYSTKNGKYPFFTCSHTILAAPNYSFDGYAILLSGNGDFNVKRYIGQFEAYQRTYVLIPTERKYHTFLYLLIKHYLPKITGGSKGSVVSFLTKDMIANFTFSVPCKIKDSLFSVLDSIYLQVDRNTKENENLAQLRDTLLPKLMNNQL